LNNKYCVKDGVTRGKAKKKALLTDSSQKVLVSTFIHDTQGFSNDDWEDFQDSSNDHEGSSPSTELDMLDAMKRRLDSGRLAREVASRNNGIALDPNKAEEVDEFVTPRWSSIFFKRSSLTLDVPEYTSQIGLLN
jgi:hypothetical protein